MTVFLSTFILSLLGMVGMVSVGLHRVKTGREVVPAKHHHRINEFLRSKLGRGYKALAMVNKRNTGLFFHFILDRIEGRFLQLKDLLHHKTGTLLEKARAKERQIGEVGEKKASDFISHIKDYTKNLKK